MSEEQEPMSVPAQIALGLFVLALITVPPGYAIKNVKDKNATVSAVLAKDPAVMKTCEVESMDLDSHPSRGGTYYTVDIGTDQCGTVLLEENVMMDEGLHMEVYKEMEIGDVYEFGLEGGKTIYSVERVSDGQE